MLVPILNSIFVFFNVQYYARWFMMPLLIMSLVSAMGMEEKLDLKKGFYFYIIFIFLLVGLLLVYHHFKGVKIFSFFHVCFVFGLGILGMILTKFFSSKYRVLFVSIVAFISLYGNYMVGLYKSYQTPEMAYSTYIQKNSELQKLKNVRSYSSNCPPNLSLVQEIPNLHSFHSNISGGAFSFYRSLGIERETSTIINDPELLSFLGVQKMITCQGNNYFISDVDSLPIGFSPNHIILQEDFEKLDYSSKIDHLMDGVVLTKEQKKKYGNLISTDSVLTDFHFLNNGFSIDYISEKDSFIVIQVPYDSGWSVSNGTIEEVDYGLMGVVVPNGSGTLHFYYHVPGLLLGVILSFFSFVLFLVYFIINKKA
jgi:hypothetical protein